jgi:hypothetical protein
VLPISQLVFLSNSFLDPQFRRNTRIPLEFITFAHIYANLYHNIRNDGVINIIGHKHRGNDVVYGGLFLLDDFSFHIRTLDAFHNCSLSALRRNHRLDPQHRVVVPTTPISFSTIDELERLKYLERPCINAHVYIGNLNHPKIKQQVANTRSQRVPDGLLRDALLNQIREEFH